MSRYAQVKRLQITLAFLVALMLGLGVAVVFATDSIYQRAYDEGYQFGADQMEMTICSQLGASDWEECQGYIDVVAP